MLTTLVILALIATGYLAWSQFNEIDRGQGRGQKVEPIRIRVDEHQSRRR